MDKPRRIIGVDFSGAKKAGKSIWICILCLEPEGLIVQNCFPAHELPNSGTSRDLALAALVSFISSQDSSTVVGLDFPFSLPLALLGVQDWETFVRSFKHRFKSAEEFQAQCKRANPHAELKRRTDQDSKTPFSPYNLRMFRQTYHGIGDLLTPLVTSRAAWAAPMQTREQGPCLIEICPASTLKKHKLYESYKGDSEDINNRRACLLNEIQLRSGLKFDKDALRLKILEDRKGDALDSLLAAWAAYLNRELLQVNVEPIHLIEGMVYH